MCDVLEIDREVVNKYRKEHSLPNPTGFSDGDIQGRLTPELIDQLMPLLRLPFDQSAVEKGKSGGYKTKGVPYALQLARLQEVFGTSHIDILHEVVEEGKVEREDKSDVYYCEVVVTLRIGNYTFYIDSTNNEPKSSFIPYYIVRGIGFEKASTTKGGAKKNAIANGMKDCFRTMGMLRYLYLDEDNDNDNKGTGNSSSNNEVVTQVVLSEKPTIYDNGALFMKCRAKDKANGNKEIVLIVYRNNQYNKEGHQQMIDLLKQHKDLLVANKELNITYRENDFNGELQYLVNKVHSNK